MEVRSATYACKLSVPIITAFFGGTSLSLGLSGRREQYRIRCPLCFSDLNIHLPCPIPSLASYPDRSLLYPHVYSKPFSLSSRGGHASISHVPPSNFFCPSGADAHPVFLRAPAVEFMGCLDPPLSTLSNAPVFSWYG